MPYATGRGVGWRFVLAWCCLLPITTAQSNDTGVAELAQELAPLLDCISGDQPTYAMQIQVAGSVGSKKHALTVHLDRIDDQSFALKVEHPLAQLAVHRTADQTLLVLPQHHVAFVGTGGVSGRDTIAPESSMANLLSPESMVAASNILAGAEPQLVASMLIQYSKLEFNRGERLWSSNKGSLRSESAADAAQPPTLHVSY